MQKIILLLRSYSLSILKIFQNNILFVVLAILTITAKIFIASLGTNPDLESWQIVGNIVSNGETIYDNTARYNYGPFWGYVCGIVALFVKSFGYPSVYGPGFHLIVAGILSCVDIVIAILISKLYRKEAGILFLINPISLILSGSHSQFDNVAVMFGLLAWYFYLRDKKTFSYIIFGISMVFKHILIFFPLWLMLIEVLKENTLKNKLKEILKISSVYIIFLASFFIEIIRGFDHKDAIIAGIVKNVINYRGYGASIGSVVTDSLIPKNLFEMSLHFPVFKGYMFFYLLFVVIAGFLFIKRKVPMTFAYPIYLAIFFALSFSVARQYYAIPLIAVFIFYDRIESLIFTIIGYVYIATTAFENLALYMKYNILVNFLGRDLRIYPWDYHITVTYNNAQAWILVLCISIILVGSIFYTKSQNLLFKNIYIGLFVLSYVSLGIYSSTLVIKPDQNLPIILSENEDTLRFTCTTPNDWAYPVYEINKGPLSDKELIKKFTSCEKENSLPYF